MNQRIEYPSRGTTYCHEEYGVYEYGSYPASSVLAGQTRRRFLGSYPTLEAAQSEFPNAEWSDTGSCFEPQPLTHVERLAEDEAGDLEQYERSQADGSY